jgi:2,3-bisphosphoglycerate-independent phosphoglycerate mutase
MKTMMVIIDGMADEPIERLGYKTTYNCAKHENLDRLAAKSHIGFFNPCPPGYLPESMNCILNLFGVSEEHFPKSRAALELLAHGHTLQEDEVVLRCNLVAVDDNRLISFNVGALDNQEMKKASQAVAVIDSNIQVIHLSCYRNLLVLKQDHFHDGDSFTNPPHESLGENIDNLLGGLCNSSQL